LKNSLQQAAENLSGKVFYTFNIRLLTPLQASGNALTGAGSKKDLANFLKQEKLPLHADQQKIYIPEFCKRRVCRICKAQGMQL
jgi:hypothetical protein